MNPTGMNVKIAKLRVVDELQLVKDESSFPFVVFGSMNLVNCTLAPTFEGKNSMSIILAAELLIQSFDHETCIHPQTRDLRG